MPTGKVRWYDPERGYGFVSNPGEEDVYLGSSALPEGVTEVIKGQKLEYEFTSGRRGPQVLRVTELGEAPQIRRPQAKYSPEKLQSMVQDTITLLETRVQPVLQAGRRPDKKEAKQIAEILRTIAQEIEL